MELLEFSDLKRSSRMGQFKLAMASHGWILVSLLIVCLTTLWLGLSTSRLWDRDEPRNARCTIEMMERGDWIVPMFNDQLRTHKPILLYWLQIACYSLLGETDFAARAASASMATLAVLATYWLGKSLVDMATGFWSAAALATSLMFVVAGRAATPDACLIATSTLGIVGLVLHWQTDSRQFTWYAVLGYLSMGLAILAKGPVGIVLPGIVVFLWAMAQTSEETIRCAIDGWRTSTTMSQRFYETASLVCSICWKVSGRLFVLRGLFLALAISAPWYIWVGVRTDGEWLYGFFFEHNIGRAMSAMEGHRGGWWFYPAAGLVGLFPWSLMLLPIGLWISGQLRKQAFRPAMQLGLIWLGVYIAIFSIARTKLPSYITPSYPGAALLIGSFLSQWSDRKFVLSTRWLSIAAGVYGFMGGVVMAAIVYLSLREQMPMILPHALWGFGFVIVAGWMFASIWKGHQYRLPWVMLASSAIFIGGLFATTGATVGLYRSDLNAILTQRTFLDSAGRAQPTQWVSLRAIEPSWVFYLKTTITELPLEPQNKLPGDEALSLIARTFQTPSGRVIVDADDVTELRRVMSERYAISISEAVSFKSFLKSNEIVVLKSSTTNSSQATLPSLAR